MFKSAASIALPRSTLILSSAMTYISFFRSFSHGYGGYNSSAPPQIGGKHSTLSARMEQCFTLATATFFRRVEV
jgi:hypothetical protein